MCNNCECVNIMCYSCGYNYSSEHTKALKVILQDSALNIIFTLYIQVG